MSPHSEIFNDIYLRKKWGVGSGSGSSAENTVAYREFLTNFIKTNGIKSVVDIGCGDWQIGSLIDWTNINYVGVDVSSVILKNTIKYAKPGIQFLECNAVSDPLPTAELAIVKDVLQHWSNADIQCFIKQLNNFDRALITNGFDPTFSHMTNIDIPTGEDHPVDLRSSPFNLQGNYVFWYYGDEPKWTFLWTK